MTYRIWFVLFILAATLAAEDISPESTVTTANSTCSTSDAHTTLDDDADRPGSDGRLLAPIRPRGQTTRNSRVTCGAAPPGATTQTFAWISIATQPLSRPEPASKLQVIRVSWSLTRSRSILGVAAPTGQTRRFCLSVLGLAGQSQVVEPATWNQSNGGRPFRE